MIAGCIDKMRADGCGGCVRRNACEDMFGHLFGPGGLFAARPERKPQPRPSARPGPFAAFLGHVAKAFEEGAKPKPKPESRFRRDVEARIEALLGSGDVRIDRVARDLGLSRQTLYRRLKAEETTFEILLDGVRKRLAIRLIRDGVAVKEAAWRLGFSDPAAFSRAFKRWTGSSPSAAR